jgi:hypothetical protein
VPQDGTSPEVPGTALDDGADANREWTDFARFWIRPDSTGSSPSRQAEKEEK